MNDFIAYLENCDGQDKHEFWTDDGKPDMDAARKFCLTVREQLDGIDSIKVSQSNNVVRISLASLCDAKT